MDRHDSWPHAAHLLEQRATADIDGLPETHT